MRKRFQRWRPWAATICGASLAVGAVALLRPTALERPSGRPAVNLSTADQRGLSGRGFHEDRFADGTPDFLRLDSPGDQEAFRRWFTLLAEYQALRPSGEIPTEIDDCAALIRFCYRNALHAHDEMWFRETQIRPPEAIPSIEKYHYPNTPLGAALFRVKPGAYEEGDAKSGAFAEFADVKTLKSFNTFFVARNVLLARPGDLLIYRQLEQDSPYHSMALVGRSQWTADGEAARTDDFVVYDTGPIGKKPGEMRRVRLADLLHHPAPRWRPVEGNRNFLGVYRWNILKGAD